MPGLQHALKETGTGPFLTYKKEISVLRATTPCEGDLMTKEFSPTESVRVTIHLRAPVRAALKSRARTRDTTMSALIRSGIESGLQDPVALAEASRIHHRTCTSARTTVDLPHRMYEALKAAAAAHGTSMQALVVAAIVRHCPDLR